MSPSKEPFDLMEQAGTATAVTASAVFAPGAERLLDATPATDGR